MSINDLNGKLIAVVRVRGKRNVKPKIRHILSQLSLLKPNHARVFVANPSIIGMLKEVKDYVTFGEISKDVAVKLILKRGRRGSKKASEFLTEDVVASFIEGVLSGKKKLRELNIEPVFRLKPPRHGWKDIKLHYPRGSLGFRDNMDFLLSRMI